uniref:Alcohol dehydrogenase 1 n=1 Tax=Ganoderma boninense TaxID=34458 RepID=A0A5K1JVW1_9APHY|nr:Alcohol dehydrogenase 1 [Ganoderma boninense]
MWLLSTDRAELHHFPSPEAIIGGYAILSHTWGDNEQTFQDTQVLRDWCKKTGKNPRDFSSEKVRQCCILAERHGYQWIWDDTCCIDKTSSSELSEAINSMFRWYSCAELDAPMSAFRTARWHSRGWTLQELIAPTVVIFVSRDWQTIGNKVELASLLREATGVSSRVLTHEVHCSTVSVAERMLWASKRSTTRVEDEAYCLMGLFNVNMPTIYGEGRQAFRRLQQEIMKQSFDTSLFAWGACTRLHVVTPVMPKEIYRFLNTSSQHHVYLLADSPKRFLKPWGRTIRYTPSANDPLQPYLDRQGATDAHCPNVVAQYRPRRAPPLPLALRRHRELCDFISHLERSQNPRDVSSDKVRESCILAQRHGFRWIWNDTCCIDKTSSTELSEAINSMFLWYSLAEVCFAYLGDVDSGCQLDAPDSAFRTARWHTRGWTLQELIAPFFVIFVSRDCKTIGNKRELAPLLEEITGVRQQVLTGEMHYSVASIAERMSWASERSTTRVEDEAYCLMGLFNVHMPTIYGEGRQAFQRLQQEIMKQSIDTSLFAWDDWVDSDHATPLELQEVYEGFDKSSRNEFYLLADSPKVFRKPFGGQTVRYTPSVKDPLQPYLDWQWDMKTDKRGLTHWVHRRFGPFGRIELPKFSFTHYGVECRFPIIESDGLTIAVLLCDTGREHIGLLLCPSNDPVQDPSRKKYHAAYCFQSPGSTSNIDSFRLISLGSDFYNLTLRLNGSVKTVSAEWRDIFIADSPPPIRKDVVPSHLCFPLHSLEPAPPFRIPHWLVGRLAQMGLELQPLDMRSHPSAEKPLLVVTKFVDFVEIEKVFVVLGTCMESPRSVAPVHWAKALVFSEDTWDDGADYEHDCGEHHVAAWPDWTKDFEDAERVVRLAFSQCTLAPDHTLVVHVELEGHIYDPMKRRKNVEFPSLARHLLSVTHPLPGVPRRFSLVATPRGGSGNRHISLRGNDQ